MECGGCIGHHVRVETEISSHAGGRRDAVIRCKTGHHDGSDPSASQSLLQVSSDECAVNALFDHWFPSSWRHDILDRVPSRSRAERGVPQTGAVLNVEHGSIGASPSIQQFCDVCFRLGVVSSTPTRIIEAFLYINNDEGSIRTQPTIRIRDQY